MSDDLHKPDFSQIKEISTVGKNVLEKYFGKKYIKVKIKIDDGGKESVKNGDGFNVYSITAKESPIYNKINSNDDLVNIKKEIIEIYTSEVIDCFLDLFDKVEDQIDDHNTIKSLEILEKTFESRKKKMGSAFKKFKIDSSWGIDKIQKEFSFLLQKILRDILMSTLDSISNGIKNSKFSVYNDVINILNNFLSILGIYTKEYQVGDKCDNEMDNLTIRPSEEIKSKEYQDVICSVESLAYLFEDDFPILEANVTVWRVS